MLELLLEVNLGHVSPSTSLGRRTARSLGSYRFFSGWVFRRFCFHAHRTATSIPRKKTPKSSTGSTDRGSFKTSEALSNRKRMTTSTRIVIRRVRTNLGICASFGHTPTTPYLDINIAFRRERICCPGHPTKVCAPVCAGFELMSITSAWHLSGSGRWRPKSIRA